ncbi:MAG: BatA domain-containing protein [Bacteroidales bacterium]|jgi:hypothetical protein|nr:BatA domain-containing protein [Bacteroidales bacterium]
MSFINPNFLWALFAISLPIIIHLINFRKFKTVYFSNTTFLKKLKNETQTRTKLKNILILISRILMIVFLVFAFAGPFIPNNKFQTENNETSLTAIYLDNSFSMQAESKKGQNYEQAKQIAKQIIFQAPESMKYLLITNDLLPEHQIITDKNTIIQNIDKLKLSPRFLSISDIYLKTGMFIQQNENANLYFISDMQQEIFDKNELKLSDNINVFFIPIQTTKSNNIYLDTCYFENPIHKLWQKETLKAKLINTSNEEVVDFPIQLYLNDSLKVMSSCNLQANEEKIIDFEYVNTNKGETNCRLSISDFPITYDNDLYFTYNISEFTNILIINEKERNRYITALFESNKEDFVVQQTSINALQTSEFEKYDVIILNNIKEIFSGLSIDLKNYISTGGSVVFIPASDVKYSNVNNFLSQFNIGKFEINVLKNAKIKNLDFNNEIFKNVFLKQEQRSDLPQIGIFHKLIQNNSSGFINLVSTETGSPILLSGNYQKGKIYVFTLPFVEANNEFLKSSLYVSILLNISLNSSLKNNIYDIIDKNSSALIIPQKDITNFEAFHLSNEKDFDSFVDIKVFGKMLNVQIPSEINNMGNYKLLDINDEKIAAVALNYNRKESNLKYLDNSTLEKYNIDYFEGKVQIISNISDNINSQLKDISQGRQLWQLFVILAIVFLICEVLLIKFFK